MNREEKRVEAVRRRIVASLYAEGLELLHTRTHLHRVVIANLLLECRERPDPVELLLSFYDAWHSSLSIGDDYADFPTYVRERIRE